MVKKTSCFILYHFCKLQNSLWLVAKIIWTHYFRNIFIGAVTLAFFSYLSITVCTWSMKKKVRTREWWNEEVEMILVVDGIIYSGIWVSLYTSTPGSSSNVALASPASSYTENTNWEGDKQRTAWIFLPNKIMRLDWHQNDQKMMTYSCYIALTHFISLSVNSRPVTNIRRGMVRIRTKGKASDTGLDLTSHRVTRHPICIAVNTCILLVLTCRGNQRPPAHHATFTRQKKSIPSVRSNKPF